MYEGSGEVTAHALAQAELAHGYVEKRFEIENGNHFVAGLRVLVMIDAIDVAEQVERFDDGQVPPQLRALSKDHADLWRRGRCVPSRGCGRGFHSGQNRVRGCRTKL